MWPGLLWFALGYASCVWDCSVSPLDPRWPSATGVFVVLLALRVPQFSVWGAALCGLVLDAVHGGPLGPRVLTGVSAATIAYHANLGRPETHWSRAAIACMVAISLWLAAPLAPAGMSGVAHSASWGLVPTLATTTLSTALFVLVIRHLIRPADRSA